MHPTACSFKFEEEQGCIDISGILNFYNHHICPICVDLPNIIQNFTMQTCALWAFKSKFTKAESNRDIQAYANVNQNKIWDHKEFVIHWFCNQLLNDTFCNPVLF